MLPSTYLPTIYNRDDWIDAYTTLTLNTADARYNRKYGINYCSDLYMSGNVYQSGSLVNLSYISGITPGSALGSKALVLDSTRSITNIYGLTVDMAGTGLDIPGLKFNGVTFDQSLYLSITKGGAAASKAVVLNSTLDFTGANYFSANTLNGTSLVSGTACDFGSYSLSGVSANVASLTGVTAGTSSANKAVIMDSLNRITLGSITTDQSSVIVRLTCLALLV